MLKTMMEIAMENRGSAHAIAHAIYDFLRPVLICIGPAGILCAATELQNGPLQAKA